MAFIDAEDGTPVLDIKPYTPSFDRVENPIVPSWCEDWPNNVETSGEFDWSTVTATEEHLQFFREWLQEQFISN